MVGGKPPVFSKPKVQLKVWISMDLDQQFREFIVRKYGVYRKGLLSHEVEEALRNWILLHEAREHTQAAHKPMAPPNPIPQVARVWENIKAYLRAKYKIEFIPGQQIPKKLIVEAIAAVRGSDPRTIQKWLKLFAQWKCFRWISPNIVEVL